MKECKPSFEKCIINKCPYFNLYREIVRGEMHIRIRCKEKDIQITKESTMKEYIFARPDEAEDTAKRDAYCRGELIRCKDCKHWLPHTQFGYDADYEEYHNYCNRHLPDDDFYAFIKEAEDYCSWAERKEE